MRVARRGCRDEVGCERLGDGGEGIEGRVITRCGSVDGSQAWEHVVQDFDNIGRGAGIWVNHDGQVGAWKGGGGAERWWKRDNWVF